MKIVNNSVEYIAQNHNAEAHIEYCARVCYASLNNKKDYTQTSHQFCKGLFRHGHKSMFRHAGIYFMIPNKDVKDDVKYAIEEIPTTYLNVFISKHYTFMSCNMQTVFDYIHLFDSLNKYQISYDEARNIEEFYKYELIYYTFIIKTGIDITRELNRKSPNAIAEQSTRYVDFTRRVGIQFKKCHWMFNTNIYRKLLYNIMCKIDEWFYKISRSKYGLNLKPEDARFCLFLDTMSTAVYTYTVNDWRHIINLRYFGSTGKPHPDAKAVISKVKEELENCGYTFSYTKAND